MALKRISGLWLRNGKKSQFMAGKSDATIPAGAKLLVFRNDRKRSDKDPDYILNLVEDDQDGIDQRSDLEQFELARREAVATGPSNDVGF